MGKTQGKDVIKGGLNAINSVLKDKFKHVIKCDNLSDNVLVMQKTTETGRITRESAIVIQPGQMAVVIDSGRVVDAVSEEGVYIFDESTTPCFAAGDFDDSLKDMWERFTFGGDTQKTQQVYYFNIKEIRENGFGTRGPVVYKDWEHPVVNPRIPSGYNAMSVAITAFGTYTFKISNPALFMREICGTAKIFEKSEISEQLQSEVIGSLQQLLNKMGTEEYKIPVLELPNASEIIKPLLREQKSQDSFERRGLKLENITIEQVKLDEASQKKIDQYELGGDQFTQQGVATSSLGEAMVNASSNTAGVGDAMMGIGFLNMGSNMFKQGNNGGMQNGMAGEMPGAPLPTAGVAGAVGMAGQTQSQGEVTCPSCGNGFVGKFCPNCGTQAPAVTLCQNCGSPVSGKFCTQCGTLVNQKKVCPDCNTPVEGKFCPNCGKQL